ncbi:OadG family protein [Oceanospirillum sediminis]|uniref:Probable oxaloacetate decarboxylase gamma chain n=1 Tax=Oceanospirillum sediminis TaxID=2760088 RepID=A0A839IUK9_9GAMM|nr:OadG family protein [Oceanospirillum sediminis]MBB1487806.1 OadG family protein [Oceanospirillum sediminis]
MQPSELISEGISLMLFGMGFVFLFLTLLVYATQAMSNVVQKYAKPAPAETKSKPAPASASAAGSNDELIAVMTAAVHKFRSGK